MRPRRAFGVAGSCVALLLPLLLGVGAAAGSHAAELQARQPKVMQRTGLANRAEPAFRGWLATHYPRFRGPSVCPSSRGARQANDGVQCVAELHKATRYMQVWAKASLGPTVTLKRLAAGSWTRRWSKWSRPPQHISPGLISVNAARFFDWRWLLLGADYKCRQQHHATCSAPALDGQWAGYDLFFIFPCRNQGSLLTCHNKLGDAVRWRPHAH
jgi:hypothetical protein